MLDINELALLIALYGGRVEHLEEEIFSDSEVAYVYLNILSKDMFWYHRCFVSTHQISVSEVVATASLAYCYAHFEMQSRWLAAEPVIAKDLGNYNTYKLRFAF